MAIGDDAVAGSMTLVAGTLAANQIDTEFNRTRDFIALGHAKWKSGVVLPISKGGHGATTAAGARTALDVPATGDVIPDSMLGAADFATANKIPVYNASGQLTSVGPSLGGHVVTLDALAAHIGASASIPIYSAGGPATAGWTVCYINGDNRISKGTSSARYKKWIHDAPALGNLFAPALREYTMRSTLDGPVDGKKHIGYIAEELLGTDAERFIVWSADESGDLRPESIDFISFLMAQVRMLHNRVLVLEGGA